MKELSLHILDALQNAVEAGASTINLCIDENLESDCLKIEIHDDGCGMSNEMVKRVLDPFVTTRTTRRVGLGLPLLAAAARGCDGALEVCSQKGAGTHITATFRHSHIDRAPLGDLPGALMPILLSSVPARLQYSHRFGPRIFEFDTDQIKRELGELPFSNPRIGLWIFHALVEGEASLHQNDSQVPNNSVATQQVEGEIGCRD